MNKGIYTAKGVPLRMTNTNMNFKKQTEYLRTKI